MILDTHVAIWVAEGIALKAAARAQIARAATAGELLLSAISAWEIVTLIRRRRLRVNIASVDYVTALFSLPGLAEAPVTAVIARAAGELPESFGGDPADRIIVATASLLGVPLATRDERILRFANDNGGLSCVPA